MTVELEAAGMRPIYEDAAVRVLSAFPPASAIDLAPGSAPLAEGSEDGPVADLRWKARAWRGWTHQFDAPLDLTGAGSVVIDLTVEGPVDDGVLRIIMWGSRLAREEGGPVVNQWHAMIHPAPEPGRQTVRIPIAEFAMIGQPPQWGYVTGLALGGIRPPGARVVVHSIRVESAAGR
ncbi:MAG: hypothetical protein IPJ41_17885 [Phycisphaerales bacterium]|nr:hypothetical protein [Phycisphaerales bacterium]